MSKVVLLSITINLFISFQLAAQQRSIDVLQEKLQQAAHDTTRLSLLNQLCKAYRYADPAKSIETGSRAYQLAKKLNNKQKMAEACYCLGAAYWVQSAYDTALVNLQQSLVLSKELNDSNGLARGYSVMGIVYRNMGNYMLALEYQHRALEVYRQLDHSRGIANTYSNIGAIYYKQGNLTKALENYLDALEVSKTLSNKKQIAGIYNNIGLVYLDQEQSDEAITYFNKAIVLQQEVGNSRGAADIYVNMASILSEKKDTTQAFDTYRKAQKIYHDLGDEQGSAAVLLGMGDIYCKQQKYQQALYKYEEALQKFKRIGHKDGIASALNAMADIYLSQKNAPASIQYAQRSIQIAKGLQAPNLVQESAGILYQAYEQQQNYQQAFQYLAMYERYKDSIINEENTEKMARLKFDYELAQKEAENKILKAQNELQAEQVTLQKTLRDVFIAGFIVMIGLAFGFLKGKHREKKANDLLSQQNEKIKALAADLKSVNTRISEQNQDLEKLNKSKDRLFSIISHDLRSPLNSLHGLLLLLQDDKLSPTDIQQIIPEIADQLSNSHTLLDNLLVWAKSQMQGLGPVIQHIRIHQLVEETIELMQISAEEKNIGLYNKTTDTEVLADPNMIRLVLRNLVGNAIKFTPVAGKIDIYTEETTGDYLQIAVRDTGMGIDRGVLKKLFKEVQYSAPGTQGEKGTGLGLLLSKNFIEHNGGKIWAESDKGRGSTFRFTVPVSDHA